MQHIAPITTLKGIHRKYLRGEIEALKTFCKVLRMSHMIDRVILYRVMPV